MPEIGATLREARMRARIDISEIEAETKIRAKYLRALENEEWGLLPGPAYVRSFLRTYAEALDLDAKLLLEEYKLRHERPSDHDLMPIGAPRRRGGGRAGAAGRSRSRPRQPRGIPVGLVVGVIIVLLVGALYGLGKLQQAATTTALGHVGRDDRARPRRRRCRRGRRPRGGGRPRRRGRPGRPGTASSESSLATVSITATGRARCSRAWSTRAATAGSTARRSTQGVTTPVYRSRSFRLRLGNGNARLRVNGTHARRPGRVADRVHDHQGDGQAGRSEEGP